MKAAEIMASNVVSVAPNASVQDLARVLLTKRISAVPVVDDHGQLVGIVSEGDLIRRAEAGTERRQSWLAHLTATPTHLAAEFVKAHARTVSDIMTRDVVTAGPDTPLSEIAALLEDHSIKRVPIAVQGKVVGIVSRADFLRVLADLQRQDGDDAADDAVLRNRIVEQLGAMLWTRPSVLNVIVQDGMAKLTGVVESEAEKRAARVAAESTPGVRAVEDNVIVQCVAAVTE